MKSIWLALSLAAIIGAAESENFVNVSGNSGIEVFPDEAVIICGVTKTHKKIDSAVNRTMKVSQAIFEISKKYGVDKSDIGTEFSELQKDYQNNRDTATYLGIKSQHIYGIRLRKIDSISAFINEMYARGMNDLRDIAFKYSKEDSVKRVASELAMLDAKANANSMVRNQGRKIGKLISASYEKPGDFEVRTNSRIDDLLGGLWGGDAGAPGRKMDLEYLKILPKKIKINVQVFAKYEIK